MLTHCIRPVRFLSHQGIHLVVLLAFFGCEGVSREDEDNDALPTGGSGGEANASAGNEGESGGNGHAHDGGMTGSSGGTQGQGVGGSLGGSDGDGGSGSDGDGGSGSDGTGGSGSDGDGGTGGTGGSDGTGGAPVNGCIDFTNRVGAEADRAITWNLDLPLDSERCLAIGVGQSVTWSGNFAFHPLSGFGGTLPNPIGSASGGDLWEITFASAGTFGFICDQHVEMQGAIRVLP